MTKSDDRSPVTQLNAQAKQADRSAVATAAGALDGDRGPALASDASAPDAVADPTDPAGSNADRAERQDIEEQLDEGLMDSFPGSDPVSVTQPQRSMSRGGGDNDKT